MLYLWAMLRGLRLPVTHCGTAPVPGMLRSVLAMVIVLMALLHGCKEPDETPANLDELRRGVPVSLSYNVRFMYTDSARVRARIQARSMEEVLEAGPPPHRLRLANEGMHITFYDMDGTQQSSLTSNKGRFDETRNTAEALGNVVVTTVEGDVLETERLIWEQRKDRIYTNEFVKITRPGEIILADSLETDSRFSFYKIYKIRGIIQVDE